MVYLLNEQLIFPDPYSGDSDGLLAVGGDLSTDRLLLAYSYGIFPWYAFRHKQIQWWCPLDRFVIFPDEIHISHSMRSLIHKRKYEFSLNRDFAGVIQGCSEQRIDHEGAWLGPEMIEAYTRLHNLGFATSVEVWEDKLLVGGLYGVTIGRNFFGESMFSRVPNASKLALIFLAKLMQTRGKCLIDCQFESEHLKSMGGRHIDYETYMQYLQDSIV